MKDGKEAFTQEIREQRDPSREKEDFPSASAKGNSTP
jgi:hypothetical protein